MTQDDVTIIIPHLGETEEQRRSLNLCIESLSGFFPQIIVATNGRKTTPGSVDLQFQGQCKAVNAAVATTNTPWIMVSNDDMVYPKGWFDRLVKPLEEDDIQCISPKLIEPRPGASTFEVFFAGGAGGDFDKAKWNGFVDRYYQEFHEVREGFNLPFLIKRELWDKVGGYDINYDPWGSNSDSDLLYKIRLAGVQPYQNTNAIVYHFSMTSGTFNPDNQGSWNKNWNYFIEKWGFPRTDIGIWEANFFIPEPPIRKFIPEWEGKYGH